MINSVQCKGGLLNINLYLHLPERFLSRRYFGDNVRDDYAAGQLDAQVRIARMPPPGYPSLISALQVEGVLQEMRELSICGAS